MTIPVSVTFTQSAVVQGYGSYHAGEVAGFAPEVAERLTAADIATRVPRWNHPFVQPALQHPDDRVRRLAETLVGLEPRLLALDERLAALRSQVRDVEREEAYAVIHNLPPINADRVRSELIAGERQRDLLAREEELVFADLFGAMAAYFVREHGAVAEGIAPTVRALADLVKKARTMWTPVEAGLKRMDELKAGAKQFDPNTERALDEFEDRLAEQIAGDAFVGLQSVKRIPRDVGELLRGIAAHQTRQRVKGR